MIIMIIIAIISLVIFSILIFMEKYNTDSTIKKICCSIGLGLFLPGMVFWFGIGFVISQGLYEYLQNLGKIKYEFHVKETIPIVSLHNNTEVNGSFFLGSGQVREQEYYFTFAKNQYGAYYRYRVPVNSSLIIESEELESPHIKVMIGQIPDNFKWWVFSFDKINYHIHVPVGTVIQQFSVK